MRDINDVLADAIRLRLHQPYHSREAARFIIDSLATAGYMIIPISEHKFGQRIKNPRRQEIAPEADERIAVDRNQVDSFVTTCPGCGRAVVTYWMKDNTGCVRGDYDLIGDSAWHKQCWDKAAADYNP